MKVRGIKLTLQGCQCRREERREIGCPFPDDVKESEGTFDARRRNDVANELIFDGISG